MEGVPVSAIDFAAFEQGKPDFEIWKEFLYLQSIWRCPDREKQIPKLYKEEKPMWEGRD